MPMTTIDRDDDESELPPYVGARYRFALGQIYRNAFREDAAPPAATGNTTPLDSTLE